MDLEPAERNPAELRRTAFILVAIMSVGAYFVLRAYDKHEKSLAPNRPPITAKITRNLAAKNQRDEFASLSSLEGKVWFAAPFCYSQLDENKHAIAAMKEIDAHYKDRDDIHFVLMSIEGVDQGITPQQLAEAAQQLGVDGTRWTLLTSNDTKKQRGYIKDQLKLGIVSPRESGDPAGKWKFPSQIALLDQGLHMRRRYDFGETHQAETEMEKKIQQHPELKDEKNIDYYLKASSRLMETLIANTDYVFAETQTGK